MLLAMVMMSGDTPKCSMANILPVRAKPVWHFVGNQQNAMLIAQLAQPLHRLGLNRVKAALALHRLKNDGGHSGWLHIALEYLLHRPLGIGQIAALARERGVVNLRWERAKTGFVGLHLAGQRHRKHAAPMKRPRQRQSRRCAGCRSGQS